MTTGTIVVMPWPPKRSPAELAAWARDVRRSLSPIELDLVLSRLRRVGRDR